MKKHRLYSWLWVVFNSILTIKGVLGQTANIKMSEKNQTSEDAQNLVNYNICIKFLIQKSEPFMNRLNDTLIAME